MIQLPKSYTPNEWDSQLDRLPSLMNIARVSLLLSLLTFHVLVNAYGSNVGMAKLASMPIFGSRFYIWAAVYGGLIVFSMVFPNWQQQKNNLPNISAVVDITMMVILMHLAGGISSGFGILILPFIGVSCLLSHGRYPLLYASYVALLLLIGTWLNYWPFEANSQAGSNAIIHTIVLSAVGYLVALLTSFYASFLNRAANTLSKHRRAFDRLKGLNELVLNHVAEAVVVVDTGSRIWLMNRQAGHYFPYVKVDRHEEMFDILVKRWQRAPTRNFITHVELGGQGVQVRARPLVREDESLLMLFIRSDQEVAMEAMATKLAALGQLTANLAHEIRNPLSAIRQSNGLLAEEDEDPMTTKLRGIIDNNIQRIDKMLEEVSSLNKSDRLDAQSINLMKFWLDFKQEFLLTRPEAKNAVHLYMQGGALKVYFDKLHLQQIIWNLINNAWQHGSKQADSITVLVKPTDDNVSVSLTVMDDGPGVSPENQPRLFEPFFTTRSEGTGLGLYVARELAHANSGQLHYHPEVKGFELIMPKDINE